MPRDELVSNPYVLIEANQNAVATHQAHGDVNPALRRVLRRVSNIAGHQFLVPTGLFV